MEELFDIVGIGELNLDYIATKQRMAELKDPLLRDVFVKLFVEEEEVKAKRQVIEAALSAVPTKTWETYLGGSTFNVIHALARMDIGCRLGFIGVAGQTGAGKSHVDALGKLGVDPFVIKSLVVEDDAESGICASYVNDQGNRSLLTHPGYHRPLGHYLLTDRNYYKPALACLSQSKVVHFTSFFEDAAPKVLLRLLQDVKNANPLTKFSFDPGSEWLHRPPHELSEFLAITDVLFVNEKEFNILEIARPGDDDDTRAQRILDKCPKGAMFIVVKSSTRLRMFSRMGKQVVATCHDVPTLDPALVEDDTGTGDVLAAGVLAGLVSAQLGADHGARLGIILAREKLLDGGTTRFNNFASLTKKYLADLCPEKHVPSRYSPEDSVMESIAQKLARLGACVEGLQGWDDKTEKSVQGAVYVVLRSEYERVAREAYVGRGPKRDYRCDILVEEPDILVEVKRIRDVTHARSLQSEINDDLFGYRITNKQRRVIFLIWDSGRHVADRNYFVQTYERLDPYVRIVFAP